MASNDEIEAELQAEIRGAVKRDMTIEQVDAFEKKVTTIRKLIQS